MLFFFNDTAATENYALTHSFPTRRSADLHVVADAGIGDEVGFDVGACLGLIDAELPGEAERADAVDDAETNGLERKSTRSEIQSLMRNSYAVFYLKKKQNIMNRKIACRTRKAEDSSKTNTKT